MHHHHHHHHTTHELLPSTSNRTTTYIVGFSPCIQLPPPTHTHSGNGHGFVGVKREVLNTEDGGNVESGIVALHWVAYSEVLEMENRVYEVNEGGNTTFSW